MELGPELVFQTQWLVRFGEGRLHEVGAAAVEEDGRGRADLRQVRLVVARRQAADAGGNPVLF